MGLQLSNLENGRMQPRDRRAAHFVNATFGAQECPELSPSSPPLPPLVPPLKPPLQPPLQPPIRPPSPCSPDTPLAPGMPPLGSSCIAVRMYDSFGDGWGAVSLLILPQGDSFTLSNGNQAERRLCMNFGCHTMHLSDGMHDDEASWQLLDCGGMSQRYKVGDQVTVCMQEDGSCAVRSQSPALPPSVPPAMPPTPLPVPLTPPVWQPRLPPSPMKPPRAPPEQPPSTPSLPPASPPTASSTAPSPLLPPMSPAPSPLCKTEMVLTRRALANQTVLHVDAYACGIEAGSLIDLGPELAQVSGFGSLLLIEPLQFSYPVGHIVRLVVTPPPAIPMLSPLEPWPSYPESGSGSGTFEEPPPLLPPPPGNPRPPSPPPELVCDTTPAAVCAGPYELCVYDEACENPNHPKYRGGLGCNAGGEVQACRFCGFAYFLPCPVVSPPAVPPASDGGAALSAALREEELGLRLLIGAVIGSALLIACYFRLHAIHARRRMRWEHRKRIEQLAQLPGQQVMGPGGVQRLRSLKSVLPHEVFSSLADLGNDANASDEPSMQERTKVRPGRRRESTARDASTSTDEGTTVEDRAQIPVVAWKDLSISADSNDIFGDVKKRKTPGDCSASLAIRSEAESLGTVGARQAKHGRLPTQPLIVLATGDAYVACVKRLARVYLLHSIELAGNRDIMHEVIHEAARLRQLQHPSLLHVFAVVADQPCGEVGLLAELTTTSLDRVLDAPPFQLTWANGLLAIATDVAAGLDFLHSKGLHHGRLFLFNVLLTSRWKAKLSEAGLDRYLHASQGDLGLAGGYDLLSGHGAHSRQLKARSVIYLAPEKCSGRVASAQRRRMDAASKIKVCERPKEKPRRRESTASASRRHRSSLGTSIGTSSLETSNPSSTPPAQAGPPPAGSRWNSTCLPAANASRTKRTPDAALSALNSIAEASTALAENTPDPVRAFDDATEAAELAEQRADAWAFGCLLASLALHQKRRKSNLTAEQRRQRPASSGRLSENSGGGPSVMTTSAGAVADKSANRNSGLGSARSSLERIFKGNSVGSKNRPLPSAPQLPRHCTRRDCVRSKHASASGGPTSPPSAEELRLQEKAAALREASCRRREESRRQSRGRSRRERETSAGSRESASSIDSEEREMSVCTRDSSRRQRRRDHDDLDGFFDDDVVDKERPGRQVTNTKMAAKIGLRQLLRTNSTALRDTIASAVSAEGTARQVQDGNAAEASSRINRRSNTWRGLVTAQCEAARLASTKFNCSSGPSSVSPPSPPPSPPDQVDSAGAVEEPADGHGPTPYVLMLRVCQGLVSPLDGVTLACCPRSLHRLATQCCALEPSDRPTLKSVVPQLQGPILQAIDSVCEVSGASRPAEPLTGWREMVEAQLRQVQGDDMPEDGAKEPSAAPTAVPASTEHVAPDGDAETGTISSESGPV